MIFKYHTCIPWLFRSTIRCRIVLIKGGLSEHQESPCYRDAHARLSFVINFSVTLEHTDIRTDFEETMRNSSAPKEGNTATFECTKAEIKQQN